ncbi:MAG: response regulator transcription factor [bacterium]
MALALKTKQRETTIQVLEPLEALEIARTAESIEEAWQGMYEKLKLFGFENCSFSLFRRSVDTPFGHKDTQQWGAFISKEFLQEIINLPEMQRLSPTLTQIRSSAQPVATFGKYSLGRLTNLEAEAYHKFINRFGITGHAVAPFHAPGSDCMMAIAWWDFDDFKAAEQHWVQYGAGFCLAATYFCQGILSTFRPLDETRETLSPRESECLLWAAAGRRSCEIAAIIGIAESTVDEYVKRAMKKLGAQTRSQACVNAIAHGIQNV